MTQRNNPYLQNRFEDNQPTTPPRRSATKRAPRSQLIKEKIMMKFRDNPILASVALMFAGAAFATIIMVSYPRGRDNDAVPVVQADAGSFREAPAETAANDPANQDSTIYSTLRSDQMKETAPIENLLDQEKPVERTAAPVAAATGTTETPVKMPNTTQSAAVMPKPSETATAATATITPPAMPDEMPAPSDTAKTPTLDHAAGESPDTLAFVRSVLDKKDGKSVADATSTTAAPAPAKTASTVTTAPSLNDVKPSSGASFTPGAYYVQLGSVSSRPGADTEFKKMQAKLSGTGLEKASYRVQEATVPSKGTFYRIQAGPMSKESAGKLCDSIKAKSPGGCLIVQP